MPILAIDTSSNACSVAIHSQTSCNELFQLTPQKHLEFLLPMVKEILQKNELTLSDLDALAFGAGPGAFAGLRIACSFIKATSMATQLPIVSVSTLQALALRVLKKYPDHIIIPSIDARQNEIYAAAYHQNQEGELVRVSNALKDQVLNQETIAHFFTKIHTENTARKPLIFIGNTEKVIADWTLAEDLVFDFNESMPHAQEIASLASHAFIKGETLNASEAEPLYLRTKVALNLQEQSELRKAIKQQKQ